MRLPLRMQGDRCATALQVRKVRILVGNREAEDIVVEGPHRAEVPRPQKNGFELRTRQRTVRPLSRHRDSRLRMGVLRDKGLPAHYQAVRTPSGCSPFTAYNTMRLDRAVYCDRSRPPSTRWTNRPAPSNISRSSGNVYARTEPWCSRVPARSITTCLVSYRPRSTSKESSCRITLPSGCTRHDWSGSTVASASRLKRSITNLPRGRSALETPTMTFRSSSVLSKYPNDVNMLIAASNSPRYGSSRMSPRTNFAFTDALRASARAAFRSGSERSYPRTS